MFNIDWNAFIAKFLEIDLRKRFHMVWLITLFTPIKKLHSQFKSFMELTLYEANINGQVSKMERMLNDHFDIVERRIFISDGDYFDEARAFSFYLDKSPRAYSFGSPDLVRVYTYGLQGLAETVDFYVNVPAGLNYDEILMHAKITRFKILGPTYKIKTF